jgi:hypothetical protein
MPILDDVKKAADWIAMALSSSGYRADFSLESLRELDRFFDDHAPNGRPMPNGLLAQDLGKRLFSVGAYAGEVIRRSVGGVWHGDEADPQAEINVSIELSDGSKIWPVQRTMKRFKNGAEDSLEHYGLRITGMSKAAK